MPRIRTIKPEFWSHEGLSGVSETAALLAIALLNYADDEGYFLANQALVKAFAFPIREPSRSVTVALRELSGIGYVDIRKCSDGREIGFIVTFKKHQVVNHARPSAFAKLHSDSCSATVALLPGIELSGIDGNGTDDHSEAGMIAPVPVKKDRKTAPDLPFAEDFEEAWAVYPRKTAKRMAQVAYVARRRAGVSAAELLAAAQGYRAYVIRTGKAEDPEHVMHGKTFFGVNERWKDYVNGVPVETVAPTPEEQRASADQTRRDLMSWTGR